MPRFKFLAVTVNIKSYSSHSFNVINVNNKNQFFESRIFCRGGSEGKML